MLFICYSFKIHVHVHTSDVTLTVVYRLAILQIIDLKSITYNKNCVINKLIITKIQSPERSCKYAAHLITCKACYKTNDLGSLSHK